MLSLSTDLARVAAPGRGRCLDFGTGTGAAIPLLAARFDEVVAIEPSKPMLELARTRVSSAALGTTGARTSFIHGTAQAEEAKALSNGSFDAVHCSLVLMVVKEDSEKLRVLEFFHRLLRPGGAVVITDIVAAPAHGRSADVAPGASRVRERRAAVPGVAHGDAAGHEVTSCPAAGANRPPRDLESTPREVRARRACLSRGAEVSCSRARPPPGGQEIQTCSPPLLRRFR
jgi:SAM-dependent methyltransferase